MLTELRIQNFAIIDELQLRFDDGLVIFTGETGAGKSIIIDAVDSHDSRAAACPDHIPLQRTTCKLLIARIVLG